MDNSQSSLRIMGRVELHRVRDGKIVHTQVGRNLVVNGGLLLMAQHLGGAVGAAPISSMICGDDNTWPNPQGSLTALGHQPAGSVVKSLSGGQITYPTPPSSGEAIVQFSATWAENENNSFVTREVGLFAAGPLLVARFVFNPEVAKSSIEQIVINYSIILQAV